jgi:hypothetical protein
MVYTEVNL